MVEKQAIGRAYRLGQTDPVHVIRYIVDDSIESVSNLVETFIQKSTILTKNRICSQNNRRSFHF